MSDPLDRAHSLARDFLASVAERPVAPPADVAALRAALRSPLPDAGAPAADVLEQLVAAADPGIVASAGPRYFGFVTGGALPVTLATEWLTAAWDQNGFTFASSPAAAVVEEVVAEWLLELLGLPADASVGLVTGAQAANVTCLAAARHAVLAGAGWDVAEDGLQGAPVVTVIAGAEAHATIFSALRMIGLGAGTARLVEADDQGAMRPESLATALADADGPTIVCAQAGNVNTGACDGLEPIADLCSRHGAWLHVDGAFGLWAAASPARRALVAGAERADSWAADAHKWLNVPYDCGLAIVADAAAHRAATGVSAAYLLASEHRDNFEYVPEASRRARGFSVYAALRHLGRKGVAELVDRCCELAARCADQLRAAGVEVLNDVVLNQVLVSFGERTPEVIAAVQRDGTCWLGGTVWRGAPAMRISVSNWSTSEADIDRSVAAILRAAA